MSNSDLAEGSRNLLVDCAALKPGNSLLIVQENPDLGWYDQEITEALKTAAQHLGARPTVLPVGPPENDRDPGITKAIRDHDCTVFLARLGDQDRFSETEPGHNSVMCYARDCQMLASAYGRASFQAFKQLKDAVNEILIAARQIKITCPLGTRLVGSVPDAAPEMAADVGLQRFPLGVPAPVMADEFSGRVALAHYLTPTGSKVYDPAFVKLEGTSFAHVKRGQISGFEGIGPDLARIEKHYDGVSRDLAIARNHVHSWHAGIHPGCSYPDSAADNPDRWSNSVFTNPRFLHVHTCGSYAPGEICWMVLDPTVSIDGLKLWDRGRLRLDACEKTRLWLVAWPDLQPLFDHPAQAIGLPTENITAEILP